MDCLATRLSRRQVVLGAGSVDLALRWSTNEQAKPPLTIIPSAWMAATIGSHPA